MKKKCIIYGGGGFIGSHIAEDLLKNNFDVTIFDKIHSSRNNIEHILRKIKFIEGDFTNEADIHKSLRGTDYVIHLVSSTRPGDSNLNPVYDVESNVASSIRLFEECVKHKIKKVIFISSGGTIYGNPVKLPIKESHPTNPTSSYGITKLMIEKYLELYHLNHGLNYTILRFSNPFGERQNPLLGQGLIGSLLYKIKHHKAVEIWGDGSIVRDYFYIKDGARAVTSALKINSKEKIFNISSGHGLSVNQILDKFRKVLNLDFDVKYKPSRKFDVKKNILDSSLASKILKWKLKADFDKALKSTWRYYCDNE